MEHRSTNRRTRRIMKAGIAACAVVATGCALFASQAGAAQVTSTEPTPGAPDYRTVTVVDSSASIKHDVSISVGGCGTVGAGGNLGIGASLGQQISLTEYIGTGYCGQTNIPSSAILKTTRLITVTDNMTIDLANY